MSGTVTGNDSVSALLVERKQRKMLISCSTDDTEIRAFFFCASVFTGKVCGNRMANVVTQGRYPEQKWEKQVGEY